MRSLKQFGALFLTLILALTLVVPAFAAEGDARFSDVDADASYANAVSWAAEHGYFNGYSDGRFGVNDNVTRAQLSAVLYRAAGSPATSGVTKFSDISTTAYYINATSWAADSGLINGYADGRFGVGDPVTRQQVAAILWRWTGSPDASAQDYTDEALISNYAQTAVDWSRTNSIIAGRSDGRFDPTTPATRVEIASALYQYMNHPSETPVDPETTAPDGNTILIAYFSATNNTENIAKHLDAILDADLYKITPETPYTSADLNYNNSSSRSSQEMNDASARPAISGSVNNMAQYDTIFLG